MRRICTFFILGSFLFALGNSTPSQEPLKPGRLPKEVQDALKPGLTLQFFGKDSAQPLDARRSRLAAFYLPANSAPSPLLEGGGWTSLTLEGYLKIPLRNSFNFQIECNGAVQFFLNGKLILDPKNGKGETKELELVKGYNLIKLQYQKPEKGDAKLRVFWSGEEFMQEPLPADALSSRSDLPRLVKNQELREGRFLFANLGCSHCHAAGVKNPAMPELGKQAPDLAGVGDRLRPGFLKQWILNPSHLRPEATMPQLLTGENREKDAEDLTAYLSTFQGEKISVSPKVPAEAVAQGEKHFQKLGCVTCHHLQDPKEADPFGRLSLAAVPAKFQPQGIEHFLQAPHRHASWSRMPDFQLNGNELAGITAYLKENCKKELPEAKAGNAERGAKLFQEIGCAQCHTMDPAKKTMDAKLAMPKSLAKGCLAKEDGQRGKSPIYHLQETQQQSLLAFLNTDAQSLGRETAVEVSMRQVVHLQCQSCHRRDGELTRWHRVLEDDAVLPELLPSLTWVGQKLKPHWTKQLLQGKHDHRARPWLKARMPAFPALADWIAQGISHEHGYGAEEDEKPLHDPQLAALGEKLMPQTGGLNCTMCHGVGDQKPVAPFEAPGINLLDAAQRIRYAYYPRWMADPPRVDRDTRMPKLNAAPNFFEGNRDLQFEALWHYIQTLPQKKK